MTDSNGSAPSRRWLVGAAAAGWAVTALAGPAAASGAAIGAAHPDAQSFLPLLHQEFVVTGADDRTTLRLIAVRRLPRGRRPAKLPDPFSLYFRGWPNRPLAGGLYQVQAPDGTRMTMFLTPVTTKAVYEAPFN